MKNLLKKEFGLTNTSIKRLNGYENVNYLVNSNDINFIFKTYHYSKELYSIVKAEIETLLILQEKNNSKYPKPIAYLDGSYIKTVEIKGKETICRMLSFIDGKSLGDVEPTSELYHSIGVFIGKMDLQLQKIDHPTFKARKWEWDTQYINLNKKYLKDIPDVKDRRLVCYFMQQYEENVIPLLPSLRKQIIHNDVNEWNLLTKNGKVEGIIDFGDLAHSHLINELAISIAYACFDKEDPLKWAEIIIRSYHSILPIEKNEVKVLYYLIAARICISVCNSAHSKLTDPDNLYATVSERSAWKLLYKWLRINPISAENHFKKAVGSSIEEPKSIYVAIKKRHQSISPILSLSYKEPILMSRSAFQYMFDAQGNTYLDAYNNIPHVGHSHPKVVEAGQRQMALLNTNTRYLYELLPRYSEKLLSKFPDPLNKVFMVNSGSAASDLAIRMAFAHTRHKKIMVMEHGYHGNTQIAMDISDYKFNNPKGQGQKEFIIKTKIPDTFRGTYKDENAGIMYAKDAIEQIKLSDTSIAAFITEPIVGCGGQIPLANGYLKEIYPTIRKQGGICIIDEVQTGFGRLGDHYWGFESHDVIPDMIIIGKPMGNGHPMGALITTNEIAESFSKGGEFFSSFGGNPVSCAIGLSVMEVIEEENLQKHAKMVGDYYKSLLLELQKKHQCIGDVRGSGLFLGIEIVQEKNIKPNTELAHYIKNELRNKHILLSTDGPYENVLKTKPPLCFTKENAREVVDTMDEILSIYN